MRQMLRAIALLAAGPALAQDAMPRGTLAYFTGECPTGWNSSQVPDGALGRTVTPTPTGGTPLQPVGGNITPDSTPQHRHSATGGSVDTGDESLILVQGCCNNNLGHGGDRQVIVSPSTFTNADLPMLFLRLCVKIAAPDPAPMPSGLMAFQPTQCPAGSTLYEDAAGRFLMGLAPGVTGPAAFGGAPLSPGEDRTHTHEFEASIELPVSEIAGASGCCAHNYAEAQTIDFRGETDAVVGEDGENGASLSYFTANLCRVN